jgi:hypothetical protein
MYLPAVTNALCLRNLVNTLIAILGQYLRDIKIVNFRRS